MRRFIDIAVSAIAIVLLAPITALVAFGVRLKLGGPVLFRQRRTGWKGKEFTIVKFRTMRGEAYPGEPDLDRDTSFGRMLRGSSLDEIPQLWNVLIGDMSLIGPRPTLPEQVARYTDHERGRLAVRPGITGWAQVKGRNSISWPERIELDLWYIAHRSLSLDLQILRLTVLTVLRRKGIMGEGGVNPGFPSPASET
jgi:lipopolysaccharide/colanic/teichoic acid biosynthesis glycosyltransferase